MMDHITDAKKPTNGKAYKDIIADPNRAIERVMIAALANPIKTLRLSKSFSRSRPSKHPAVINPQKYETASAPTTCGSKP